MLTPLRRRGGHVHDADVWDGVRGRGFILAFAVGCVLSSVYGFLSGAWLFGVVGLIWSGVAVRRYSRTEEIGPSRRDGAT